MSDLSAPKLSKWPFFLGDGLLLGMACFIAWQSKFALGHWELCFVVLCVVGGALLGLAPFLLEYDALVKLAEAGALTTVVSQLHNLEGIAAQISGATSQWQDAQDQADKTARSAREIAERMTAEVKAFTEFMQQANDSERATLRLEVEKLRRAESDWLQVVVRMLDHVYALHQGALRSGQPNLIEQLGNFQSACRDAARRVGLTPFTANEAEPFDVQRHQLVEAGAKPPPDAVVAETIATGYTFQGRLVRPALVRLRENPAAVAAPQPEAANEKQSHLPLTAADSSVP
ncbi:MAG: nucleotide exchange factor GrpE [Verrucomicrobiota bacterium]|jgi:molecular chaperone GrpE (heat shock protein)